MSSTEWDLSCPDWRERLTSGRSLIPELPLFTADGARALALFNKLRIPDVFGKPTLADGGAEWFREIVTALFGSYSAEKSERYIREIFALVPKKNAKTTYGAAVMMTALLANKRPRAEFLLVGPSKLVAETAFSQAVGMIDADPEGWLSGVMHVQEHIKTITFRPTKAQLKIKSFDTGVLTGVKPVGVLVDELHEIAAHKDADRVIGQIRGGLLPNPEGFLVFITTQSERPPTGVFKTELNKARMVRDGLRGVRTLPVIYEFPEDYLSGGVEARWRDPQNWWMVTPNRGKSITVDRLMQDFEGAKATGEGEIIRWASQHLNIEVGVGIRTDAWVGARFWESSADESLTLDALIARSDVAVVGIDGGGMDDLFGLTIVGRDRASREWISWSRAFAHRSVVAVRKSIAQCLYDFERDGDLVFVDDARTDIAAIIAIIQRLADAEILPERGAIGLDPIGVGAVIDALESSGLGGERLRGVSQGFKLMGAIKTTERKLSDGSLRHAAQPLMGWCVGNAKVEPKGNAILITKQAAGSAKIDPLMALFNAVSLMSENPEPPQGGPSMYEEQPLRLLRL